MQSNTFTIWRRIGYIVSFLAVAGVAAYVSYGHIADVAVLAHQPRLLAQLLPFSVDGLMLISTLALAEDKAANRSRRPWAVFAFWFGAAVSIAANIASTWVHYGPEPLALAVAGWAPIALLIAVEVVSKPGKPKSTPVPQAENTADFVADDAVVPVSPAPVGNQRGDYGPRDPERGYAPSTLRGKAAKAKAAAKSAE